MMCKVLIFGCISAAMLMTTAYGAPLLSGKLSILQELIGDIEILQKSKNNIVLDLYTPTETQECSWQTLQCYLDEMDTLKKEIEDEAETQNKNAVYNIKKNLQSILTDLNPSEGECKICEANNKKNLTDFLGDLSNLLRSMQK